MSTFGQSNTANPRVLVTYAWVRSSWAIIRSLARRGLKVYAADKQRVFMSRFSRYCSGWFQYPDYQTDPLAFVDALAKFIEAMDIGTYLPSHEEGFVVARHRDRFPSTVAIPIAPWQTIASMHNKRRAQDIAAELGISHPQTFVFNNLDEFEQQRCHLPKHGIIKSVQSHGSHGVSIYRSPEELSYRWQRRIAGLSPHEELPIIQEYIPARIYAATLLAWKGQVIATFVRRNLREKEPFGGTCVKCESVHAPELIDAATRIARHLEYSGVAMFEFLVDEKQKNSWLMEINPRYWGTTAHDLDCGVDYPYLQYCLANGIPFESPPTYKDGIISRWIAGDVISYLKRRRGHSTPWRLLGEYLRWDARYSMDFKLDDPLPFFVQSYLYFKFRKQIFAVET